MCESRYRPLGILNITRRREDLEKQIATRREIPDSEDSNWSDDQAVRVRAPSDLTNSTSVPLLARFLQRLRENREWFRWSSMEILSDSLRARKHIELVFLASPTLYLSQHIAFFFDTSKNMAAHNGPRPPHPVPQDYVDNRLAANLSNLRQRL